MEGWPFPLSAADDPIAPKTHGEIPPGDDFDAVDDPLPRLVADEHPVAEGTFLRKCAKAFQVAALDIPGGLGLDRDFRRCLL